MPAWFSRSRDQIIVGASIAGIIMLAWIYLGFVAADMSAGMAMPDMPEMRPSPAGQVALWILMWLVMMAGMMLPSSMPMILVHAKVQQKQSRHPVPVTGLFGLGYLAVWGGFAVLAALLQTVLVQLSLLSPELALSMRLAGCLFLLAAAYEFSALKERCLSHCRSPVAFMMQHWRPGPGGAFRMGVLHGAFCLGCCWALMLLLFALGVMNLLWVAVLAVLVLAQKLLPGGRRVTQATGLAMGAAGLLLIAFPL